MQISRISLLLRQQYVTEPGHKKKKKEAEAETQRKTYCMRIPLSSACNHLFLFRSLSSMDGTKEKS